VKMLKYEKVWLRYPYNKNLCEVMRTTHGIITTDGYRFHVMKTGKQQTYNGKNAKIYSLLSSFIEKNTWTHIGEIQPNEISLPCHPHTPVMFFPKGDDLYHWHDGGGYSVNVGCCRNITPVNRGGIFKLDSTYVRQALYGMRGIVNIDSLYLMRQFEVIYATYLIKLSDHFGHAAYIMSADITLDEGKSWRYIL